MDGYPVMAMLLVGLGIDQLSMSPFSLPPIKKAIRSVTFVQAQEIAEKAMEFKTSEEIKNYAREKIKLLIPDLFEE